MLIVFVVFNFDVLEEKNMIRYLISFVIKM